MSRINGTMYSPRRVLVTGGAGFIGANWVHYALGQNARGRPVYETIVTLDSLTYAGSLDNLRDLPNPERHTFVKGEINDQQLVAELLRRYEIDTVIHFAAESHVDRSIDGPAQFIRSNIIGTFTLLEQVRQYWLEEARLDGHSHRFHHISTDEVYGSLGPDDPPFTETTPYAPNSPYSASKAASDHLVRSYCHTYGLSVTTTNCSNNYGPYQHAEKLIPTVIRKCLTHQPIPVYGDGSNIRDWLYVLDHCRAIDEVLCHGRVGETYNVGGNNEWRNLDIVRLICGMLDELEPRELPYSELITFVTDRPGHDWRYAVSTDKIHRELGWTPQETFTTGLRKTVHWYLGPGRERLLRLAQ